MSYSLSSRETTEIYNLVQKKPTKKDGDITAEIVPNLHANCDIHLVIDHHACTEYYYKGRETVVRDVFIDVVFYLSDDLLQRAAIKKLVIEAAGERYGDSRGNASDNIFELYRSSFNTLPVSLENRRKMIFIIFRN